MADTIYQTANGPKTLAQITAEMHTAGWNGNYSDPASLLAAYNQTASGASSQTSTGGSGNAAQDLLDAIASGDQQKFDESIKEFQQTSSTNLATSLLGTASQLGGPQDWLKFNQYTSGGRDLWQQLYGDQPRPDFSAPTGPITPQTLSTLMQSLGMLPATPAPTTVNPAAPAGSVPANMLSPQAVTAPPAPVTPLSGVATAVGATPAVTQQAVNAPLPTTPAVTPQAVAPATSPLAPADVTPPVSTIATPGQWPGQTPGPSTATNGGQPIPLPYQIHPAVWDALGSTGQSMALAAAKAAGWDPNEYLRQINMSRPQGTAPGASSTAFKTAVGAFS